MNLQAILSLLGLSSMGGKMAWIIGIVTSVYAWYTLNKEKIHAIIIRIEKEKADGWTSDEKEQLAVDIFFSEIYPTIPAWIRLIPFVKTIIEKIIRSIIKKICSKASALKDATAKKIFEGNTEVGIASDK